MRSGSGRGVRSRSTLALALALVALAASAPAMAGGTRGATRTEWLDHPGRVSYWAFVDYATTARTRPGFKSKGFAHIGRKTEDGTDNLVLVLARAKRGGRTWLKVRLPILPNNRTGWVPADDLSSLRVVHTWLKLDRSRLRITLVRKGRVIFRAPVGIGAPGTPTPAGNFYIRDELTSFPPGTIYGALAFGTSGKSATLTDWPKGGVIGLHGTNQPQLIPGRISHGCIRLRNHDITRLAKLLPIGTPLTIR